jgi:hypothetical protein
VRDGRAVGSLMLWRPSITHVAICGRRWRLLFAAVCAVALAVWAEPARPAFADVLSAAALIQAENALPGTTSWYVPTPDQSAIAGYASDVSYESGDTVTLYVDSKGDPFSYAVYRVGYYQGLGGREVLNGHVAANATQPAPTITDDRTGGARLLLTGWHPSASFAVDPDWVSGYYLVKLEDDVNGKASYATFVVRSTSPAPLVVNLSTNTWQAYNIWGGLSLYSGAHTVSFQRPYQETYGAGPFFRFDRPLVEYLEKRGMPVSYATDEDAGAQREAGPQTRLVIVDGHDEYQDLAERQYLAALPAQGVSLAFTGGNDLIWQARLDDPNHQMSVWRLRRLDPVDQGAGATIRWEQVGWYQNVLTGEMQAWGAPTTPERAYATRHWAWMGAAVSPGTALGPLEGHEFDGVVVNARTPSHLTVLARSPLRPRALLNGAPHPAQAMTIIERPGSGFVFSAGMTNFDWYLDYPGVTPAAWVDPEPGRYPTSSQVSPPIRRLVGNLLGRALDIPNPEPVAGRPSRVTPPMHILSFRRLQAVFSAPGRPAVTWADAPRDTVAIRISYAGRHVATVGRRRDFWIGARGLPLLGFHTITVSAINARGRVIAQGRRRVDFRSPSDPIFYANSRGLRRLWAATTQG